MSPEAHASRPGGARGYASDTLWMMSAQVAGKLASVVFVVIVARSLAARDFGYFNFALSLVPMFLVVGGLGIESTLIRDLARDRAHLSELFASGLVVRVALGIVGLALALAVGPAFLGVGVAYAALALVGFALFVDELTSFLGTVFKAFEQMKFHALAIFVNRVLSTALALGAVAADGGLLVLCLTYLAGSIGALVFAAVALRRRFPPIDLGAASRRAASSLLRKGAPLGVGGVLNMAAFRIDSVLLQGLSGAVAVGVYGAAYRLFESSLFVAWSLGNVALPRLSRASGQRELSRMFGLTTVLALAFYLPLATTTPFAAEWIVASLFSERYASAASALTLLAAASVFYALALLARVGAIAVGKRAEIAYIAAVALAVNVAANLLFIPRYGIEGAAAVMLATEVVEAALLTALFARAAGVRSLPRSALVPLLATACLSAVLWGFGLRDGAAVLLAVLLYPAALALAARIFAPAETRIALDVLLRRPPQPEHV